MTATRMLALAVVAVTALGCADSKADNDTIRARPTDVFKYDHFDYDTSRRGDNAHLVFRDMGTGEFVEWRGGAQDAMVYLESLDKGQCYRRPVDRGHAEKVACG